MVKKILAIFLLSAIGFSANSAGIDFAPPIQVGTTWVYQDTSSGHGEYFFYGYGYLEIVTVTKVTKSNPDTTIYNATIHDSGWIQPAMKDLSKLDTTYSITDTIISYSVTDPSRGNMSTKDTASWNLRDSGGCSHFVGCICLRSGQFLKYNNLVEYLGTVYCGDWNFGNSDTVRYLEKVGLIYKYASNWSMAGPNGEFSIQKLITFNGKTPLELSETSIIHLQKIEAIFDETPRFEKIALVHGASYFHLPLSTAVYDVFGRRLKSIPSQTTGVFILYR